MTIPVLLLPQKKYEILYVRYFRKLIVSKTRDFYCGIKYKNMKNKSNESV